MSVNEPFLTVADVGEGSGVDGLGDAEAKALELGDELGVGRCDVPSGPVHPTVSTSAIKQAIRRTG